MVFYSKSKAYLLAFALVVSLLPSCKESTSEVPIDNSADEEYIMYQPSEMANFMNALYAYNQGLKTQILNGETPVNMPLDLVTLHKAEMTKGKGRSEAWENVVDIYIESQKYVVDSMAQDDLIARYNTAINNCLTCHKTECTGPIPRIRKLLIQ
jgi:cytochrome c553